MHKGPRYYSCIQALASLVLGMPEILLQGLIFVNFFFKYPRDLFPFEVILSMWVFHLRFDCSVTPRYFAEVTGSRM